MANLSTKLTSHYPWVSTPIIANAPMRTMAGPALAVAVSQAGGLGFIGPSPQTSNTLSDLKEATELIQKSQSKRLLNHDHHHPTLPVGVGFLIWNDDLETAISAIETYKPSAVWLYGPPKGQTDTNRWIERIRSSSTSDIPIWLQIGSVSEAKDIIQSPVHNHPDVVVVQGTEAGGHGRKTDGMGLIALLPEIADTFNHANLGHIPLFAAGGISDARGAAAALCLGAEGVVMGTRFLASTEARITKGYRDEVVRASDGGTSTTKTLLYNHLLGVYGWPEPFCPRVILNQSWVDQQAGVGFEEIQKRFQEDAKKGDAGWGPLGRMPTYAGAGIGLIEGVEDADVIVEKVRDGMVKRVRV